MNEIDRRLSVPFLNQYVDVLTPEYRQRACGMCCVRMALEYFKTPDLPSIDEMIRAGMEDPRGYSEHGWRHDYFVSLFQSFGYACERKEKMTEADVAQIQQAIHMKNPVVISCQYHMFDRHNFHIVIVTGVRETADGKIVGLFYNNPMSLQTEGSYTPLADFLKDWRRMAIFPQKGA